MPAVLSECAPPQGGHDLIAAHFMRAAYGAVIAATFDGRQRRQQAVVRRQGLHAKHADSQNPFHNSARNSGHAGVPVDVAV